MDYHDLRVLYLYEFLLGHNGAVAARRMCQAFGEATIGERAIRRWYEKFRRRDFDLSKGPRSSLNDSISLDDDEASNEHDLSMHEAALNASSAYAPSQHLDKILLYEYKLGSSAGKAYQSLKQAYGEQNIDEAAIKKLFKAMRKNDNAQTPLQKSVKKSELKTKPAIRKSEMLKKVQPKAVKSLKKAKKAITAAPTLKPQNKIKIKLKFLGTKKRKKKKDMLL